MLHLRRGAEGKYHMRYAKVTTSHRYPNNINVLSSTFFTDEVEYSKQYQYLKYKISTISKN